MDTTATVIMTGNSLALRVPKAYVDRNNLRVGTKVKLPDLAATGGTLGDLRSTINNLRSKNQIPTWDAIKDPSKWQTQQRAQWQ